MPIELKPVAGGGRRIASISRPASLSGDWSWLGEQDYSPNRAFVASSNRARGSIFGGPTFEQRLDLGDYQQDRVVPHVVIDPALPGTRVGPGSRIGTVELDMIDPFASIDQLTGEAIGLTRPIIGDGGTLLDPQLFLASKDFDLFGLEQTGAPARLADYALAFPTLLAARLMGSQHKVAAPDVDADLPYAFQRDPGYWMLVNSLDDEQLRGLATELAARYIDPARNGYLVDTLHDQLMRDKAQLLGLTSGNEQTDWIAKQNVYARSQGGGPTSTVLSPGAGFQVLPLVGTQLAQLFVPDDTKRAIEAAWQAADPQLRHQALTDAGWQGMAHDFIGSLPALTGIGTALSVAKASGGLAGTAYRAYDLTLRGSSAIMAAGLAAALTNWGLEAFWPGYSEWVGEDIDHARPISQSSVAAVVNQVGFWSSGTWGGWPLAKVAGRAIRPIAAPVGRAAAAPLARAAGHVVEAGREVGRAGRELTFFRQGVGGSMIRDELARTGLSPNGIELSTRRTFLSYLMNRVQTSARRSWESALRGEPTGDVRIDNLDFEAKVVLANEAFARERGMTEVATEGLVRTMQVARLELPAIASTEARELVERARLIARDLDDELTAAYVTEYGPSFVRRIVGSNDVGAMEAWARAKVQALGGDPEHLGRHDAGDWEKIIRALHNYEFDQLNGELVAAWEGAEEAGRLTIVRARSLHRGAVDDALALLRGEDDAAAEREVLDLVAGFDEVERWMVDEWQPRPGVERTPANIPPEALANWLEDVRPSLPVHRTLPDPASPTAAMPLNALHARVARDGTWALAFKPVDEAGNFVSYARTRDGGVFKSPWLDYPLSSVEQIELGNRGYFASKLDSVFGGFRTWRISEFQRGSLYRRVGAILPNATAAQIDALHQGILKIAREARLQPQATGALPEWAAPGNLVREKLEKLVTDVFGKTDALRVKDWRREIAKAYRQAYKLNLTAGLTSHLKSRFDVIGEQIAFGSDFLYPIWRFDMSPVFKGGELTESAGFNVIRGVDPRGDPVTEALFYRGGVGNDFGAGLVASEMTYDQTLAALQGPSVGAEHTLRRRFGAAPPRDSGARFAASMSWYARRLPEDMNLRLEIEATHAAADAPWQRAMLLRDTIEAIQRDGEAIHPDSGAALGPDAIPALESEALQALEVEPDLPPLHTGDREGLLRQLRATMADEPMAGRTRANELRTELDDLIGENGVYPGLELRAQQILDELEAIERGQDVELGPRGTDRLEDIPGTPEAFEDLIERTAPELATTGPSAARRGWDTFWHPTKYKEHQALLLQIDMMRDSFPELLRLSGNDGVVEVFRGLGIPETEWATWLLEDRRLLQEHLNARTPETFAAFLDHAGGQFSETRGAFDALYASDGWAALTALWDLNVSTTANEAFGVHFFRPYRSAFERSINHPLLGIYPASWAYKAAREWAQFLFANRAFGELQLGMTPAVAIAQVARAQQIAFAQANPDELEHFLEKGPLGSTIFIFNLLMPGDWSAIPFPASRTIREIVRGNWSFERLVGSQLEFMGMTRDARLILDSMGEIGHLLTGPQDEEATRARARAWSWRGDETLYGQPRR